MPVVVEQVERFFDQHPEHQAQRDLTLASFRQVANSLPHRLVPLPYARVILGILADAFFQARQDDIWYDKIMLDNYDHRVLRHYQPPRCLKQKP